MFGDPDPLSAGTAGEAARWGGSIAAMGMAANPSGAHQAGRVFAGRTDEMCVSVRDLRTLTPVTRLLKSDKIIPRLRTR